MKPRQKQAICKIKRTSYWAETNKSNKVFPYTQYQKLRLLYKAGILLVKFPLLFDNKIICFINDNTSASAHN